MQKQIFLFVFIVLGFVCSIDAQNQEHDQSKQSTLKKEVFTVYGNCGMCEKTIEGSLHDVMGIESADWDRETDQMTVTFNPTEISFPEIKQKIADVGYDSDTHRAKDEVYNRLPGCCQYDRPE